MKERPGDLERAVVAHDQAPEVSQPADGAFDNPASPIPPQRATILCRRSNTILLVRADPLDATPLQPPSQGIAVVGFVGNHPHGLLPRPARALAAAYADRCERRLREPDFRRGCRVKLVSQRNTRA